MLALPHTSGILNINVKWVKAPLCRPCPAVTKLSHTASDHVGHVHDLRASRQPVAFGGADTRQTLVLGHELSASTVYSSMAVFDMLREQLIDTFYTVPTLIQGKVSLDRFSDFLNKVRRLDSGGTRRRPDATADGASGPLRIPQG